MLLSKSESATTVIKTAAHDRYHPPTILAEFSENVLNIRRIVNKHPNADFTAAFLDDFLRWVNRNRLHLTRRPAPKPSIHINGLHALTKRAIHPNAMLIMILEIGLLNHLLPIKNQRLIRNIV